MLAVTLLTQGWVFALYVLCGRALCGLAGWPPVQIALYMLRGLLGALAVISLQLLLSMVIRSFAVPVLIALAGSVVGMVLVAQDAGLCWPYALVLLGMNANRAQDQLSGEMGGVCACVSGVHGVAWPAGARAADPAGRAGMRRQSAGMLRKG